MKEGPPTGTGMRFTLLHPKISEAGQSNFFRVTHKSPSNNGKTYTRGEESKPSQERALARRE